eukprot:TRINITY_DN6972_c0_g1_i4.p1 TRINITY_DN6972_c0_g1~~TRINITY_DN6972_c0_g1_i4.p1  ORF type:complete len:326 (-),score=74.65 TRINITY_DN6972_c0_g1_i4:307-1284(-)
MSRYSANPEMTAALTSVGMSLCHPHSHLRILPVNFQRKRGYHVLRTAAAAVSAKESSPKLELSFAIGSRLIPHPRKVAKGGEDAIFVNTANGGVLAVADGVSGWAEEDIDPAVFPQELVANLSLALDDEEINHDPVLLMQKAHEATNSVGSATLLIAMLEKNGVLKIANVGDCGLCVLQEGHITFSTYPQEHYFDCPYQLSSESVGQSYKDALSYNLKVKEGDVVVMGSDGLFDNVFKYEIERIVGSFGRVNSKDAQKLVDLASLHSGDPTFESPYCLEARNKGYGIPLWKKLLGLRFTGGKLDDITVIVGIVVRSPLLAGKSDV